LLPLALQADARLPLAAGEIATPKVHHLLRTGRQCHVSAVQRWDVRLLLITIVSTINTYMASASNPMLWAPRECHNALTQH
jgi:hypothetical protein